MTGLKEESQLLLRQLQASARKKLGQNFMVDENALRFIARSLEVQDGETVIEIGPGLGFLTRYLLERGVAVTAIEKDPVYVEFLSKFFAGYRFAVEKADVLKTDLGRLSAGGRVKVFGNIPYHITSPILEWLITGRRFVSEAVLTVQWEVAERLKAVPGTKDWGCLSIFLQYYAQVKTLKKLSPSVFSPEPKVDSAVIHISFLGTPDCQAADEDLFFHLVRRAFQKRRKTLLNALAQGDEGLYSKKILAGLLKEVDIDPVRRPETLSLEDWARLSGRIGSSGQGLADL